MKLCDCLARTALPRLEAHLLWQQVLGVSRSWLIAHDTDDALDEVQCAAYQALEARRLAGEPMAYILGHREFFGRDFHVTPAVLVPRPETECLVECALDAIALVPAPQVLDLGTGSGAVGVTIALERRDAQVQAVDCSVAALAVAKMNACNLGTSLLFSVGNWYDSQPEGMRYDLIVSNPPYVCADDAHLQTGDLRFEPKVALTDGGNGLTALDCVVRGAPRHLIGGGALCVEHGWDQASSVRTLFEQQGFVEVASLRDLAGIERVTVGRLPVRPHF